MDKFSWAVHPIKIQRAIALAGAEATEEQIKAQYIALGGLVVDEEGYAEPESVKGDAPVVEKKPRAVRKVMKVEVKKRK